MNRTSRRIRLLLLTLLAGIALGALAVYLLGRLYRYAHRDALSRTLDLIESDYVDSVNLPELRSALIPLLLKQLDPHSDYIPREENIAESQRLEGSFVGIGIAYNIITDTIVVDRVEEGGPSQRAGILPGDRILAVGSLPLVGDSLSGDYATRHLRGPEGSVAQLRVLRAGRLHTINVTRGVVPIKSIDVSYLITPGIGVVRLNTWGAATPQEFRAAASELLNLGAKSLILDLRDNGGGYMGAAVELANEFLDAEDLIVYSMGRQMPREEIYADGRGAYRRIPFVILVNEFTASASEIFSAAMQDHDRAPIIGRRTFGKGLVQRSYLFPDSSAIHLTVARYYTPSGRSIQKEYQMGNRSAYDQELLRRFTDGEVYATDSVPHPEGDTTRYYTDSGRVMYGGQGILPDIFIPRETMYPNAYYNRLIDSGALPQFVFLWVDKNRRRLSALKDIPALRNYLADKDWLVYHLADYAAAECGVPQRAAMLEEVKAPLFKQLSALMAYQLFGVEGLYRYSAPDDAMLQEAQALLQEMSAEGKLMPF